MCTFCSERKRQTYHNVTQWIEMSECTATDSPLSLQ
jgi:hypothetical protein